MDIEFLKENIDSLISELFQNQEAIDINKKCEIGEEISGEESEILKKIYIEYYSYSTFLILYYIYKNIGKDSKLLIDNDYITILEKKIKLINVAYFDKNITINDILNSLEGENGELNAKYPFTENNIVELQGIYLYFKDIVEFHYKLFNTNEIIGKQILKKIINFNLTRNNVKYLLYSTVSIHSVYKYLYNKFSENVGNLFFYAKFILHYFDEIFPMITYNKDILLNMNIFRENMNIFRENMKDDEIEIYDKYTLMSDSVITLVYELFKNNQNNLAESIIRYMYNIHLQNCNEEVITRILKIATLDIYSEYFQDVLKLFIKEKHKNVKIKYMKYKNKYYKLKSSITYYK